MGETSINARLDQAFEMRIGGVESGFGSCFAVWGDGLQHLRSEIGNRLAKRSSEAGLRGISCVAYVEEAMGAADKIKLSFRGIGAEDTTPITKHFGGGGHAKASSCVVPLEEFESWRVECAGAEGSSDKRA